MRKVLLWLVAATAGVWLLFAAGVVFLAFARPPQPLRLGTIQWLGEAGVTVDSVDRAVTLRSGKRSAKAAGVFYVVHARIVAPFGLRPHWSDRDVEVRTFAHSGRTGPAGVSYLVDENAQSVEDSLTGRPGPEHEVMGASQREDLVFDLPRNVEQPGIVFKAANDPMGLLDVLVWHAWQPHRFNLRYD